MRNRRTNVVRTHRKWEKAEDDLMVRTIRSFPHNLHKCFLIVSESTGRTDKAVAARWYQTVSKRPDVMCFFTASPKHVSKNRKNGMGEESNSSIWRRLMAIIRNL